MVSEWRRQAVRAASASIIAPLVLLLAAAAIASGGNLGGLESLGQVASGPALPETGVAEQGDTSLADAEIVGADLSTSPSAPAPPAASAAGGGGAELAQATPAPTAPRPSPSPTLETAPAAPPTPVQPTPVPQVETPTDAPAAEPTVQPTPNVVQEVLDTTRGLAEGLPGPLGPLTTELLDLLLGQPAAP